MVWHKFFFYQVLRTVHEIQFRVTFRVPVRNSLSMTHNFNVYHSTRIICISANLHNTFTNYDFCWQVVSLHAWTQTMDYTDDRGTQIIRGTSGPSTDVSAVGCASAIPCDFGKVSPKRSSRRKNLECVHSKSNHKGRRINTLKTWQNAYISEWH